MVLGAFRLTATNRSIQLCHQHRSIQLCRGIVQRARGRREGPADGFQTVVLRPFGAGFEYAFLRFFQPLNCLRFPGGFADRGDPSGSRSSDAMVETVPSDLFVRAGKKSKWRDLRAGVLDPTTRFQLIDVRPLTIA